ncbi:DNA repair protein endonuclease SAE2/CtIP C-terminus-domain-containing protein [Chaetomium tenue]|uniref:DNA repair protein endonuclease SAE2/CtIP C-terminus-domain-containing protein n=1 Tax=Chaetomium tenue TaxID=1854479 RepID=A0ACB7PM06_9PEZI|nr:DNA repair protein endonuclease SAE2/CtIP C-terminus-domain-containing protein [Chaetomium globosum]
MDYWPRKGRPTLLAALEAACDSVEEDLAAEIRQRYEDRHETLLAEVGRLQAVAERVDQLENENRSLVRELDQLRSRQDTSPPPATRPVLAEISTNTKLDALATGASECDPEKAVDWERNFSKLAARYASLEERQEEIHRVAKKYRVERDGWTKYAQSLEGRIAKLKKVQRSKNADDQLPPSSSAKPRPAPVNQTGAFSDRAVLDSSIVAKPEQAINPTSRGDPPQDFMGSGEVTPTPGTSLPGHARSLDEETQDGSDGADDLPLPQGTPPGSAVRIKEEPSSDAPVIVSERTIRKRKHTDDEAGMPAPPRRIKSEQSSSWEPVITGEAPIFCPHESIDLDEEERGMPTPRKQQQWESRHILREDKDVAPMEERSGEARPIEKQVYTSTRGPDSDLDRSATAALSPHKPSRAHKDRERPIRAGWTLDSGIADVAEETFESFYALKPRNVGNGSTHETPTHGRLHSLLNDNSPKKSGAFLSPARLRHGSASPRFDKENIENMRAEETEERSGALVKLAPIVSASKATPLRRHDKGNPSKPGRLRDRPPAGLRPEDFKVNPRSNNGFKHAFDEVVRSREERAELAGCTDPNCCGRQFRAMAESELSAGGPGILSRVADIKMMEDYLGTEAYQLVEMTREERQETWLKAKIQDLANRLGRHRHRFARRPSPPGYWNPDFPSTQEIEKNKEEAERAERSLVEERWREAMRGGRWLFRDE